MSFNTSFLTAQCICRAMNIDMDREQWDLYDSVCRLFVDFARQSEMLVCDGETLCLLAYQMSRAGDPRCQDVTKACLVLEPDNEKFKAFFKYLIEGLNGLADVRSCS